MKVSARKANGNPVEADFEFGDNLDAMVEKFGDEIVYNHARGSLVVALQGFMRGQIDAEKSPKEIAAAVREWSPGKRKQGKSPQEKIRDQLDKLDPETRAQLIKEFRGQNSNRRAAAE